MTEIELRAAKEVLAKAFDLSQSDIPENAALDNFEPWDSLGHVQVLSTVEALLKRELETEEAISIVDLQSLQDTLQQSGVLI